MSFDNGWMYIEKLWSYSWEWWTCFAFTLRCNVFFIFENQYNHCIQTSKSNLDMLFILFNKIRTRLCSENTALCANIRISVILREYFSIYFVLVNIYESYFISLNLPTRSVFNSRAMSTFWNSILCAPNNLSVSEHFWVSYSVYASFQSCFGFFVNWILKYGFAILIHSERWYNLFCKILLLHIL